MGSPLLTILDYIKSSNEFQKLANTLPPTIGTITGYDRDTQKVSIIYPNPTTGETLTFNNIDISKISGFHHRINPDDLVMIVFKEGNIHCPVVCMVIDNTPDIAAGHTTTKSSKGF